MRRLFKNAELILPPGKEPCTPVPGFLCEEAGVICLVVKREEHPEFEKLLLQEEEVANEVIDCCGDYLAPGFIDLHCHGALGRDTMEATPEAFDAILDFHAKRGTTLAVLTTVAASWTEMEGVLKTAQSYGTQSSRISRRLAGIHLEGPYFSPFRRGAHRAEMLRHPSSEETDRLLGYAEVISRMTVAPELPGAINLVRKLVERGIAVSAGHSNATEEESAAGFEAGITQATHLYNCMSSLRSEEGRRVTGLAEASLTTNGILCEVIADGRHLPSTLLRLTWLAKGWEGVALVSDATAGAGLAEGSSFVLGGLSCRIESGAAWTGEGKDRRLAGGTFSQINGVQVLVEQAGVPLSEAVAMASLVPAKALGQENTTGSLAQGKRADLVRISKEWVIGGVWSSGRKIA